jgi:hypothetical protein
MRGRVILAGIGLIGRRVAVWRLRLGGGNREVPGERGQEKRGENSHGIISAGERDGAGCFISKGFRNNS